MAACEPEMWTSLRLSEGRERREDGGDGIFAQDPGSPFLLALCLFVPPPPPFSFILKGSGVTHSGIMAKAPGPLCWAGLVRRGRLKCLVCANVPIAASLGSPGSSQTQLPPHSAGTITLGEVGPWGTSPHKRHPVQGWRAVDIHTKGHCGQNKRGTWG